MNQLLNSQNQIIEQTKGDHFFYLYKIHEFITK